VTDARQRSLGVAALVVVMLLFSWGSTLVKLAETPGVTVAFWRMAMCSVIWVVYLRLKEGRWTSVADFKAALLPGVAFGLDIAAFFIGVTKTTVASAEFTASLTPIVVIPLAAVFFKERMRLAPLTFGVLSIAGLALLLFNAPPDGEFSWTGVSWIIAAVGLWSAYLLTSRQLRQGRSVAVVMAHITPIATVVTLPIALVVFPGTLFEVTGRSVVFISLLAVLTGTVAHGLMVYAQHSVPVGVISLAQVAQPALAVTWSVLFLGSSVVGIQIVGMAMVIAGIAAVTVATQRGR
jgi:drug/metabolite transporter (DMT)-like permease